MVIIFDRRQCISKTWVRLKKGNPLRRVILSERDAYGWHVVGVKRLSKRICTLPSECESPECVVRVHPPAYASNPAVEAGRTKRPRAMYNRIYLKQMYKLHISKCTKSIVRTNLNLNLSYIPVYELDYLPPPPKTQN